MKNSPLQNCVFITQIDKNGEIDNIAIVDFLLNLGVVAFLTEITWAHVKHELSSQSQLQPPRLIPDPYY